MMIHEITSEAGARKRRKRVGRGEASGKGKTCGRGTKGAQSRAGTHDHPLAEGGQLPFFRRVAKRGFSNAEFKTEFEVINLGTLEKFFDAGQTVSPQTLRERRLISRRDAMVKVLAKGELGSKKLTVEAHAFSEKAKSAIEQAGGAVKMIPQRDSAALAKAKRKTAKNRRSTPRTVSVRLEKRRAARNGSQNG